MTKSVSVPRPNASVFGGRDRRLFVLAEWEIFGFDKTGKSIGRALRSGNQSTRSPGRRQEQDRLIVAPSSGRQPVVGAIASGRFNLLAGTARAVHVDRRGKLSCRGAGGDCDVPIGMGNRVESLLDGNLAAGPSYSKSREA